MSGMQFTREECFRYTSHTRTREGTTCRHAPYFLSGGGGGGGGGGEGNEGNEVTETRKGEEG